MKIIKVKNHNKLDIIQTIWINTPDWLIDFVGIVFISVAIAFIISVVGGIN